MIDPNNVAIPDNIRSAINVLNYIQLGTSFFTIVLTFVVRSPVIAWGLSEDPDISSKWEIALYTALDPMTLYYCSASHALQCVALTLAGVFLKLSQVLHIICPA